VSSSQHQPLADEVLDINDALIALEAEDVELARIVKLRFFAGLMMDQIAEILGTSKSTVERKWTFAKAWLGRRLNEDSDAIP
jgi:DNA-binding transcriptional regulator YiaG